MECTEKNSREQAILWALEKVLDQLTGDQWMCLDAEKQQCINQFLGEYGEDYIKKTRSSLPLWYKEKVLSHAHSSQCVSYISSLLGDNAETTNFLVSRYTLMNLLWQEVNA